MTLKDFFRFFQLNASGVATLLRLLLNFAGASKQQEHETIMQNMFGVYILQYNQSLVLQKQRFYQSIMTNTTWIHGYVFPAVCKPTFEHSKRQKILTGTLKIPALTLECHPNPLQNRSLMVGPKGNNLLHF